MVGTVKKVDGEYLETKELTTPRFQAFMSYVEASPPPESRFRGSWFV
jgi:hypothetical protein